MNERGYETAFCQALAAQGYRIVYRSVHGPMEQGKDIVALSPNGEIHAYQLKTGDIDQRQWRQIIGEINDLVELPVVHPNVNHAEPFQPSFVCNGRISDPVRLDIVNRNQGWNRRGFPSLRLIQKDDLFHLFNTLHGRFLPLGPVDLERFLRLYLSDKTDFLDKPAFAAFLESFLPLDSEIPRAEIRRLFAGTAVLANYVLSGFEASRNYLAVAEGWCIVFSYLLRIAERIARYRVLWKRPLDLCVASWVEAVHSLVAEGLQSRNFLEGDPTVDHIFVNARKTIVLGYTSGLALYYRIRREPLTNDAELFGKVYESLKGVDFWGESATPYFMAMALHLWCYGKEALATALLGELVGVICRFNDRDQKLGLPDPYYDVQSVFRARTLNEPIFGLGQSFTGCSYSIRSLVEFIARRWRRRLLTYLWYGISEIDAAEFIPSDVADMYKWHCRRGVSATRRWPHPQSWQDLVEQAERPRAPGLLMLREYPEMVLPFVMTYPHRLTPDLMAYVDAVVVRQVETTYFCK